MNQASFDSLDRNSMMTGASIDIFNSRFDIVVFGVIGKS